VDIYMVGGAVRDKLLALPVTDRDWVVTGATPAEMIALGYRQVGKDFPVFLHPRTQEEYALARTERKVGPGYKGFVFDTSADVTLEDDLRRRDLTINAMAETPDGSLIDPFNGAEDLRHRRLRHVSSAFAEDPVRILRVARFAARFAPLGFEVVPETMDLMRAMVGNGEADALVAERVWVECMRALGEAAPSRFVSVLRDCGALARILPELDRLFGVPQSSTHHPEVDTGVHALLALDQATALTPDTAVRFAVLVHDLGKGVTPQSEWPRHVGHEEQSVRLILEVCGRLRTPHEYRDLAVLVARYHTLCHRAQSLRATTVFKVLQGTDALRRPARFEQFLLACEADHRGRAGLESRPYPQRQLFREARAAACSVDVRPLLAQGLKGEELAAALRRERIVAIRAQTGAG